MNSDPFNPLERSVGTTYRTIKILSEYDYPYIILTKNTLVVDEDYLKLYKKDSAYFQMTITTFDDRYASAMEPHASPPLSRIEAIRKLGSMGFKTAFRINPLFPIYPDGHFSGGAAKSVEELRYFSFDLVRKLAAAKPHCIIAGFLRVCNVHMHNEIRTKTGIDLKKYFCKNDRYFSRTEIRKYYEKIKGICDDHRINFSVCFDADDNYEYFKDLWANKEDCCCGKNMVPMFTKTALDAH